jgi:ribonuclease P protein component
LLAAAERLRRRNDFTAAVRRGRRGMRGVVVVHLLESRYGAEPVPVTGAVARAGLIVPRAVGSAVERNLVRRRLRHLLRSRLSELPGASDVVVRALPGAARRPYGELGDDLDTAIAAATRVRSGDGRPRGSARGRRS